MLARYALMSGMMSDPVKMMESAMQCAMRSMNPYMDDMQECMQQAHPDLDFEGMMKELRDKMQNSREVQSMTARSPYDRTRATAPSSSRS